MGKIYKTFRITKRRAIVLSLLILSTICFSACCSNNGYPKAEYPKRSVNKAGYITQINDSIVVIQTHIKGMDNYETKVINLKKYEQ